MRPRPPLLLPALLVLFTLAAATATRAEMRQLALNPLKRTIADRTVTFLAHEPDLDITFALDGGDLDRRHIPWSTFKIANSLIALEQGAAASLDTIRQWDAAKRPARNYWPANWKRDHSLRSAFRYSVLWYFQDVAQQVGAPAYRKLLADWDYGNAQADEPVDLFWLDGTLRISVEEQVDFMDRLLAGKLDISDATRDAFMEASLVSEQEGIRLHGKTGAGPVDPGRMDGAFEGWFVGFVQRPDRAPAAFALFTTAPSFKSLQEFRKSFSIRLLKKAGILPTSFAAKG